MADSRPPIGNDTTALFCLTKSCVSPNIFNPGRCNTNLNLKCAMQTWFTITADLINAMGIQVHKEMAISFPWARKHAESPDAISKERSTMIRAKGTRKISM